MHPQAERAALSGNAALNTTFINSSCGFHFLEFFILVCSLISYFLLCLYIQLLCSCNTQ